MKNLSFLLLAILCGCVNHSTAADDKLTLASQELLRNKGIEAKSALEAKSQKFVLDDRLSPYVRPDGKLYIKPVGGECETIMTLITLGIFPGGCFNYVVVKDSGANDEVKIKDQENMVGWLLLPLVVLPDFSFGTEITAKQYNDGAITALNQLSAKK